MTRFRRATSALPVIISFLLMRPGLGQAPSDIPRPEHPRPDFERTRWLNLNGLWQFEIDEKGDGEERGLISGKDLAQSILVPFCPESRLSGIGRAEFMTHVWYRRSFEVPPDMADKRLLLHFEAVDWQARVWLNGQAIGTHHGGYSPFAFEITDLIREGSNELVLHAIDDTRSGMQATGKQAHSPASEGCVYTRTTGIWQTVWLEAVGDTYLKSFALTPDLAAGRLFFQGWVEGPCNGAKVRLRASLDGKAVGHETVPASWRATLGAVKLRKIRPWWPGKPTLYDLDIEIEREGRVLDSVHTAFGLRKISIEGNRFLINDTPIFQRLVLDQGFYPDGIYTAPTDEALRRDIEISMAAGFNGARLHQKVFEPRFLHWADRMGYMVWGEYPSWGLNLGHLVAVGHALEEWRTVLERDRNHPSIVGWCPLNETGAGEDVAAVQHALADTQVMDPTRPFLDSSGYVHLFPGIDVYDSHDYDQNPETFRSRYDPFSLTGMNPFNNVASDPRSAYRGQPYFVSEIGGIRLKTDKEVGQGWGYGTTMASLEEFLSRYKGLMDALLDNSNVCGFCYTQLTDIEQEQNGIYYYDRQSKYDPSLVKTINARPAAYETDAPRVRRLVWTDLLSSAEAGPESWRYTTVSPAEEWFQMNFDDRAWQEGPSGFGAPGTPGAIVGTLWVTQDIWMRRCFSVASLDADFAALNIHHDEDAEVYINGQKVASLTGYTTGYTPIEATDAILKALVLGENVIAVHCRQTAGGQYLDVGIVVAQESDAP